MLADGFFRTFPQLEGLRFTHAWGGLIDTCTRFTAFYGTAMGGRVGYALGFTGLGVAATRFAGDVVLDLLDGLGHPAHAAGDGAHETAAVPARAVPVGWASRPPPAPWRALTPTAAARTSGSRRWTGWASASTPEAPTSVVPVTPWLLLDYGDVISLPYDDQVGAEVARLLDLTRRH